MGAVHPDTLTSMANLASTYRNQGRWKKAEELPDTLTSMNNLAFTWKGQGRGAEAIELMEKCVFLPASVLDGGYQLVPPKFCLDGTQQMS